MDSSLAPIVLFVYNRPEHTRRALESLMNNDVADRSDLYIFADGPKKDCSALQLNKIKETRELLLEKKWCKNVYINEMTENMGVDAIIIMGVTKIVNEFEKVIVLEDDLVTSKGFLTYMNDALHCYKTDEKVMHIAAYVFPIKKKKPGTFFIYGGTSSWGWATWKRAWAHFDPDHSSLISRIEDKPSFAKRFNFSGSFDYLDMLKNCNETHKPWDIRWYASVFLKGAYGLWPTVSLVQNIGHDNSGVHCVTTNKYQHKELATYIPVIKIPVEEGRNERKMIISFFKNLHPTGLFSRIKNRIRRKDR